MTLNALYLCQNRQLLGAYKLIDIVHCEHHVIICDIDVK